MSACNLNLLFFIHFYACVNVWAYYMILFNQQIPIIFISLLLAPNWISKLIFRVVIYGYSWVQLIVSTKVNIFFYRIPSIKNFSMMIRTILADMGVLAKTVNNVMKWWYEKIRFYYCENSYCSWMWNVWTEVSDYSTIFFRVFKQLGRTVAELMQHKLPLILKWVCHVVQHYCYI